MSLAIKKKRELIFQLLYSSSFTNMLKDDLVNLLMKENKISKKNIFESFSYVEKICDKLEFLNKQISSISKSYELERISTAELSIIRLAIYEIKFDENIPCKVSIAEAIRLTKKYANNNSVSFVNAILDAFLKNENL